MRYMLLIYSDQNYYANITPEENGKIMEAYGKFSEEVAQAGIVAGSDRLKPTTAATTVRVRNGEGITTDGPFAETKEALGGYYEIDVPSLDEALAWAQKIPTATYGSVEVRPIWEPEEYMS